MKRKTWNHVVFGNTIRNLSKHIMLLMLFIQQEISSSRFLKEFFLKRIEARKVFHSKVKTRYATKAITMMKISDSLMEDVLTKKEQVVLYLFSWFWN